MYLVNLCLKFCQKLQIRCSYDQGGLPVRDFDKTRMNVMLLLPFLSPRWYAQFWWQSVEFVGLLSAERKSKQNWKMASEVILKLKFKNINIPVCVFEYFYWKIWNSIPGSFFKNSKFYIYEKKCIRNIVLLLLPWLLTLKIYRPNSSTGGPPCLRSHYF